MCMIFFKAVLTSTCIPPVACITHAKQFYGLTMFTSTHLYDFIPIDYIMFAFFNIKSKNKAE